MSELKTNMHFYSERQTEWKNTKFTRKVAFAGLVKDNKLQIGISECSEKDIFDKKKGRLIATGRANKKPVLVIDIPTEGKITDAFVQACKGILKE